MCRVCTPRPVPPSCVCSLLSAGLCSAKQSLLAETRREGLRAAAAETCLFEEPVGWQVGQEGDGEGSARLSTSSGLGRCGTLRGPTRL